MQPSPSLRALLQQAWQEIAAKNLAWLLASESREPGVRFIGTAPNEWVDLAGWEPIMRASVENSSGKIPADLEIEAFEEGTVGWAAYRWTFQMPNGGIISTRVTMVCHKENGEWKEVQFHASVGIPDDLVPSIAQPAS